MTVGRPRAVKVTGNRAAIHDSSSPIEQINQTAISCPLGRISRFTRTVQVSRLRTGPLPRSFLFNDFPTHVFGLKAQQLAHIIEGKSPIALLLLNPALSVAKTALPDSVTCRAVMAKAVNRVFQYGKQQSFLRLQIFAAAENAQILS
ncbi:MAG: hypothetical protein ACXWYD_09835 [Candidatus Binatia bacterium]